MRPTRLPASLAALLLISGTANDSAMAEPPPAKTQPDQSIAAAAKPAALASNAFGLDLFRTISATKGPDKNLFISPYSVSVALTMCAEGARGQTEQEMATVLHFSTPKDGERSISAIHTGYAALTKRFAEAAGASDPETRKKITESRRLLDEWNDKAGRLRRAQNWEDAQDAAVQAEKAAADLNALLATVDRFDLRTANALWVEKTFSLLPEYVRTIDTFYGTGGVTPVDFLHQPEPARTRINTWVEDHTEKRIKDLLPKGSIAPDTRLVIVNAVYFKGEWADPFKEANTRDEDFSLAAGSTVKARLMQDHWRTSVPYAAFNADGTFFETPRQVPRDEAQRPKTYPDDGGFTLIELPYKGNELSMTVILPRKADGLSTIEKLLTPEALDAWLAHLDRRTVDTALPRFKMEYEQDLSHDLQTLGMRRAFNNPGSPGGAEFAGMSASTNPAEQLFIGLVQHKAWVEVTEKGTEAAAATAVAMRAGSAVLPQEMIPFNPVFRADHPFLFLIRDTKSGIVLFLGRVANPV